MSSESVSLPVPELSVVVPVHDEADNIASLIAEIEAALSGQLAFEIIYVDDASRDATAARLAEAALRHRSLRVLTHRSNSGQSTAVANGVRQARAALVATLDGDGQNDPADILVLWRRWQAETAAPVAPPGSVNSGPPVPLLLAGWRVDRRDTPLRRVSSRVANGVRGWMLGDATPDTGCGLKLFERETFLRLPFFDHLHRFLPALVLREGGRVVSVPVRHRARQHGRSHYGVSNRLWVGLVDIAGVIWLRRRMRITAVLEAERPRDGAG